MGAARVAVTALAMAGIAGVIGYALGQARFEHQPVWYQPLVLVLAAVLNGLFFFSQDLVTQRGLNVTPLYGLAFAAGFALVLLAAVSWLTHRANAETLALSRGAPQRSPDQGGAS